MANLLTDVILTSAHVFGGTFADITGMSSVVSIAGPDSVVIMMASLVPRENVAGKICVEYRFTVDGSPVGGELASMVEQTPRFSGQELVFAVEGLSAGNHTFAVQGRNREATAGECDTTRNRTFQVLELDFGASILVDLASSSADAAPGAFADVANLTVSATPQLGSLLLFTAGLPAFSDENDETADYRFAIDGVRDGPYRSHYNKRFDRQDSLSMTWAEEGVSAASHTFSLQWEDRRRAPDTDTTRTRYLQVIEIEDFFSLEIDNSSVAADSAPVAYADMVGMSGSATIDSTDSIALILANYVQDATGGNVKERADSRLTVGGTFEGQEQAHWKDNNDRVAGITMNRAADNESGVTAFAMQWQIGLATPTADTARERTFQVIDLLTTEGQMRAFPAMAISATADLRGRGELSASPAMVFALGADINGIGGLNASPDMVFDVAASIQDKQLASANPQMAFTMTADIRNASPQTENLSRHIDRFIN